MDDVKTGRRWRAPGRARLWAEGRWQSQPMGAANTAPSGPKLPLSGTRDTSLLMSDRDRKPPFQRGGGKGPDKRRESGRRPPWRDRDAGLGRAGHPVWLAHGGGGAGQSAAPDSQAVAVRKRRPAPGRRQYRHPRDAGNRPAEPDRPAARSGRRASGPAGRGRSPALAGYRYAAAGGHRAGARPDHRSAQCRRDHALGGGVRGQGDRHHRAPQPRSDRRAGEVRFRRAGAGADRDGAKSRARAHRD